MFGDDPFCLSNKNTIGRKGNAAFTAAALPEIS
jgi:hypothetical protein